MVNNSVSCTLKLKAQTWYIDAQCIFCTFLFPMKVALFQTTFLYSEIRSKNAKNKKKCLIKLYNKN